MPFFIRRKFMKLTDKQLKIIEDLGYETPLEFLTHYPFRYEFLYEKDYDKWLSGDTLIFEGQLVSNFATYRFGRNQSRTTFKVLFQDEIVSCTIFNMPFLNTSHYKKGIVVVGTVGDNHGVNVKRVSNKPIETQKGIQPIYSTKTTIKQHEIKRLMYKLLEGLEIKDVIPDNYKEKYKLLDRQTAIRWVHLPKSEEHLKLALRTLKYEEFLLYHLVNGMNAGDLSKGFPKSWDSLKIEDAIKALPYRLTQDQTQALDEILSDLNAKKQMNRLLQGDVGSGKTVVALLSAYANILAGYQTVFMVPTELLLEQHYQSVLKLLPNIKIAVLSSTTENKTELLNQIKMGTFDLILGTHALFQEEVIFHKLGMVIIDEQHRFGVNQRRALIEKGDFVDTLMLSATPIPRSLAASLFFNLDVSNIQSYPAYKKENTTILIEENSIRSILDDLRMRLNTGDQMYVVCPSIDEKERKHVRNVTDIYTQFLQLFPSKKVAKIHSQIPTEEKEQIMHDFSLGLIDILVSTTIIEVGIDVHNANTMVIYNAELFGLATLHQLRGRIGRGESAGVCYLLSNHESKERLEALVSSNDGFELSMMDLKLRGMGDILGSRQSGLPHFILGDLDQDQAILAQAKIDAQEILQENRLYESLIEVAKSIKMMYN